MSRKSNNTTKRGVPFDLNAILMQNQNTIAVGNIPVNARGDRIGPGGKVIAKAEDIARETIKHVPHTPPRSMSIKRKSSNEIDKEMLEASTERKQVKKSVQKIKPTETILPNGDIIKGDK